MFVKQVRCRFIIEEYLLFHPIYERILSDVSEIITFGYFK